MNNAQTEAWRQILKSQTSPHLLQIPEWAELKSHFGWSSEIVTGEETGAQILFRHLPFGFSIGYIPKGPVGFPHQWKTLWPQIDSICQKNKAVFLKIEPDFWETQTAEITAELSNYAAPASPIQPRRSVVVHLSGCPDEWLARMKQKTRYNIRLAEKKEVIISESNDLKTFQRLMEETGARNEFGVHNFNYYQTAYRLMTPDHCAILLASYHDIPLAAIMVFYVGKRAWYFYGASSNSERNRMPTYLLQFEAMKWAASKGCLEYDLWGIPDFPEDQLEEQFSSRSDGLWGVYRFKRGFGGEIIRSVGAFDRIYHPILYKLYQKVVRRENA